MNAHAKPDSLSENVLSSRAMLASVKITAWTGRRVDRKITDEVHTAHNAAADAGRYAKNLLTKEALAGIQSAISAARAVHSERTLPWLDDGARILPARGFEDYSRRLRYARDEFEAAVDAFVLAYPGYIEDARKRLNGMFDESDYPLPSKIRERFSLEVRILPVPDARDFRVQLGDAQAADLRAEVERTTQEALRSAMGEVWNRVADVTTRMVERLRAYKPATGADRAEGMFRDSLVQNIRDLIALLPALNLTNDAGLAAVTERMESELCGHDAAELRDSEKLRKSTAAAAEAILAQVSDFLA